jgi:uncharacterized membrane protein
VFGELWAVHGGGFYNSQKYLTRPERRTSFRPSPLVEVGGVHDVDVGMGLLALIYWYGASSYLIDRSVMALSPPAAIAISIAFIAGGWLVYDVRVPGACRPRRNVLAWSCWRS